MFIFTLILLLYFPIYATNHDILVAVLMVKNEAPVMCQTLQPLVDAGIKSFFIFDTGSTDDTIETVERFFAEHSSCCYVIFSEQFIDFATSRNRALDLAESYFEQATFMVMLDAEWHLVNGAKLINFCHEHEHDKDAVYLMRIISGIDFYTSRLIRTKSGARFSGAVHECIAASAKVPADVYFELKTTSYGRQKSKARWKRDALILEKEYEKNPSDSRTCFYLAQTYECLDDYESALFYYLKRLKLDGWDEENFITRYRIAQLYEKLSYLNNDEQLWHHAQHYYFDAYAYRPTRAEPLIKLAIAYRLKDLFYPAFLCAHKAALMPYPSCDTLFVEKNLYEYYRYDVLGIVAWYCKEYNIGLWAVEKAIEKHPEYQHLHYNKQLYEKLIFN